MKYTTKSRKTAGKRIFPAINLPSDYAWKILGWLSEDLRQFLTNEEFERVSRITRERDFDSLITLSEDWSLQCSPSNETSLCNYTAKLQLSSLLKKFRFATDRKIRLSRAKDKFLAGESSCASYNREGYMQLVGATESWMTDVFTYARSFMEKVLGDDLPSFNVLSERSRHGPGATLDTDYGQVMSYHKFTKWPYQCTRAALRYARLAIETDERWLGALEDDYRTRFGIPKYAILDRKVFWDNVLSVVDGNRISFVPKDARVERSIAIEPTMNLYLQLGVDGYIRRRLKRWGVDLNSQEKNQRLARLGSVQQVDPFVTIDLANASNSISLKLCEALLPKDWYNYLIALRSPLGVLGEDHIHYEMISSMGNGYTFALESALFTSIIYGVMRQACGTFKREDFAVFGDDLIVRQSLFPRLEIALANCGFTINSDKTFISGPIRESCGTDWFQGKPLRPVFLHEIP